MGLGFRARRQSLRLGEPACWEGPDLALRCWGKKEVEHRSLKSQFQNPEGTKNERESQLNVEWMGHLTRAL